MRAEIVEYIDATTDDPFTDEPAFPNEDYQNLYRDLVRRMEAEASVLPGMGTAVSLMIRRLARDYVVGVIADQSTGDMAVRANAVSNDRRMLTLFKMLLEQAARSDLEHALRTEFVLGLINETMRVLDGEVSDDALRVRLKELLGESFVRYTESVQGRIGK